MPISRPASKFEADKGTGSNNAFLGERRVDVADFAYIEAGQDEILASSLYRHSAFASFICLGVRHSGSNRRGLAMRMAAHLAAISTTGGS
ncbi:MAG: hypothetical protein WBD07_03205 [Vicinamibacterales bacterium]